MESLEDCKIQIEAAVAKRQARADTPEAQRELLDIQRQSREYLHQIYLGESAAQQREAKNPTNYRN